MMSLRLKGIVTVFVLSLVFVGRSFAINFQPDRLEVRTGYAYQYTNNSRPHNFDEVLLLPSLTYPLSQPIGPSWLRGKFEWNPELYLALFTHPYVRPILGFTPLQFQYVLEPHGRLSPYITAGAGVLRASINRRETGSRINFNPQAAIGLRYLFAQNKALILEYRHIHISNAGLHENNAGLNTHTFLIGVSFS